jgi:hypothetical protein
VVRLLRPAAENLHNCGLMHRKRTYSTGKPWRLSNGQGAGDSIRCGHLLNQRSKSSDDFGCSPTGASDIIERLPHFLQIWRFTAQPVYPSLCASDRRRERVDDLVDLRMVGAHEFRRDDLQWRLALRAAHTSFRREKVLIMLC